MSSNIECIQDAFERIGARELHVSDIGAELCRLYPDRFDDLEAAKNMASSTLASHVKSKKPLFRKVKNKNGKSYKKGIYALKGTRKKSINLSEHIGDTTKANTGRAGEFAVISELIFRGHNATILPVDTGIDVISTKGERFFHIQVKTKHCHANDESAAFTIKKSAYEGNRRSSDFYVFVLRKAKGSHWLTDFIVLHASQLEFIYESTRGASMSVKFTFRQNSIYLGKTDVSSSLNNFSKIS